MPSGGPRAYRGKWILLPPWKFGPNQAHLPNFGGAIEYLRALFGSPTSANAPFQSSFLNVLTLSEQLSFQETRKNLVWIGPDATMDKFGAIDFSNKVYTIFPTDLIPRMYRPGEDWPSDFIIAISELCSLVSFLVMRGPFLKHKLVAYTGDKSNVIIWLQFRRSGNERARFLLRILARCEQTFSFRTHPLYIPTFNNIDCDNLTRLSDELTVLYANQRGWLYLDPQAVFRFYHSGMFLRRAPSAPSDNSDTFEYLFQLSEKRTYRSVPVSLMALPLVISLGTGTGGWAVVFDNTEDLQGLNYSWPSEILDSGAPSPPFPRHLPITFRINFFRNPP